MGLSLLNLEMENVRKIMLEELELDVGEKRVYKSRYLKESHEGVYINLFKESILNGDTDHFANNISINNCLMSRVPDKKTKSGDRKVPSNAHITLAEGEFNRFYIRSLCRIAIDQNLDLEIYRAKDVREPRPESEAKIGEKVEPSSLLTNLKTNPIVHKALGIPDPNSGLSIKIK
jgi:hypothetical protein